jgi:hypothetical protein
MKADDRILSAARKAKGCPFQGSSRVPQPWQDLKASRVLRRAFSGTEGSNPSSSGGESVSAVNSSAVGREPPRFRGALRGHRDVRRDVPRASWHHCAFFSDGH